MKQEAPTSTSRSGSQYRIMKVRNLEEILGEGWKIYPAGGVTGEAFLAMNHAGEKVFIKRNSSPFLAILSAEGIVPKLLWTKRIGTGDVLTSQEWVEGHQLQPDEIQDLRVSELLHKIHTSQPLLTLLKRIYKQPFDIRRAYMRVESIAARYREDDRLQKAVDFMRVHMEKICSYPQVVCHGDLNHHNFIHAKSGELYLIDWDQIKIADCCYDLAYILIYYVPKAEWSEWLERYGLNLLENWETRIMWYSFYLLFDTIEKTEQAGQSVNLIIDFPQFRRLLDEL